MRRIPPFLAVLILAALSSSLGHTASLVWADTSSMDWDMNMTDTGGTANDPVCPSDTDNSIDTGECPEMDSNLHIDVKDAASNESFFDLATQIWKTGLPGPDLDGDGLPEPLDGIAQFNGNTLAHGTTVGQITFQIKNSLNPGFLPSGIDPADGQRPECGSAGTTTFAPAPFYLWKAITNNLQTVSYQDTDLDGIVETQENNFTVGSCGSGPADGTGIPDGVDCTPTPIPAIQAAAGLPAANYTGRSFGVANLPIFPPAVYNPVDVNFLSYNMVGVAEVQGYIQFTVVLYPGTPSANPLLNPGSVTGQTVTTCPPYGSSPVRVYGITQDSDFTIPANGTIELVTPNQVNRKVIGSGGPYDSFIFKSVGEDWDGDTISDHYDHCPWDPGSGALAGDTDGDSLTGLCETTGAGNGEGNNPGPYGTAANAWSAGQDVDGDTFINSADNCSIIADADVTGDTVIDYQLDTDQDGVGDVCEKSPLLGLPAGAELVAGDGRGYPGRMIGDMVQVVAPGKFVDRDNLCTDPFSIGAAEPRYDTGRSCLAFDTVTNAELISDCTNAIDDDGDTLVNDGCPAVGAPETGAQCANAINDDPSLTDTVVNDGCPAAGPTTLAVLGRVVKDSNDDADPDLLDWPAGNPIEFMDTNSDSDGDGDTDACEAYMGTDPLDASSSPASAAGDCDGSGGTDAAEEGGAGDGNPFTGLDPDADGDGCLRSMEDPTGTASRPGFTAAGGVSYQDSAWYDFYDVPAPANNDPTPNGTRNKAVNVSDVVGVLKYVGTFDGGPSNGKVDYDSDKDGNGTDDGIDYDRSPSPAPNPPKDAGPPSGAVNVSDVVAVLGQTGRSCIP